MPSPSKATYYESETAALNAKPASGWRFAYWTGDLAGFTSPKTILLTNSNKTVNTTFHLFE